MDFDIRNKTPVVSVCLLAYNHAPYVRECLDSILMQKTDFPYEICIGEDGSTDGTRGICREYAERYPERINLILRPRSEADRKKYAAHGNFNYVETLKACRGRYIADCDADDVWLDSGKLQKQFNLLESDPTLSLVHSDYAKGSASSGRILSPHVHRDRGLKHVIDPDPSRFMYDVLTSRYHIMTVAVVTRSSAVMAVLGESPELFRRFPNGDIPLWTELTRHGSFAYVDEPLSLYRVLDESATHSKDPVRGLTYWNGNEDLKLHLARKYGLPTEEILCDKVCISNRLALVSGDDSEISELYRKHRSSFSFKERLYYGLARFSITRGMLRRIYRIVYSRRNY